MTDATHAKCPRCNRFEPIIFTPTIIEEVYPDGRVGRIDGLALKCRACQFEITIIGAFTQRQIA